MATTSTPEPTERELRILAILWERGESTVREIHALLQDELPIVQNTVQAFLRTMTDKGLVTFRKVNRTFVYRPIVEPQQTKRRLLDGLLQRAFDGAIDQLVESAVSLRRPTPAELTRLRELLDAAESNQPQGVR